MCGDTLFGHKQTPTACPAPAMDAQEGNVFSYGVSIPGHSRVRFLFVDVVRFLIYQPLSSPHCLSSPSLYDTILGNNETMKEMTSGYGCHSDVQKSLQLYRHMLPDSLTATDDKQDNNKQVMDMSFF